MALRDDRLHELSDIEFELLASRLCVRWLGEGFSPFARGKDGGRDGKFVGTANCFPSSTAPLTGHIVVQAKHVASPDKSCSDNDFQRIIRGEHEQISRLVEEGLCDHYIVITNRKYTGGTDEKLTKALLTLGLKSVHIIGTERLRIALDDYADIRNSLPNQRDTSPFRFEPSDIAEVIMALGSYLQDNSSSLVPYDSSIDFNIIAIADKNKLNGVSNEFYESVIVAGSMPHFQSVKEFLANPRNIKLTSLYHDSADELKQKLVLHRYAFANFDDALVSMYEHIQSRSPQLKGKRRLITIVLHYMYCNCDIGMKRSPSVGITENADA